MSNENFVFSQITGILRPTGLFYYMKSLSSSIMLTVTGGALNNLGIIITGFLG